MGVSILVPGTYLLLLLLLPLATVAFVAPINQQFSGIRRTNQIPITRRVVLSDPTETNVVWTDRDVLLPSSSEDGVDWALSSTRLKEPMDLMNDVSALNDEEVDVGKAIFLANAKENAELVEVIERVNEQPDSLDNEFSILSSSSLEVSSSSSSTEPNKMDTLTTVAATLTEETVFAVLAASEAAAAAAQAKLAMSSSSDFSSSTLTRDTTSNVLEAKRIVKATESQAALYEEKEDSIVAPSVAKILKFAVPAIGVWLCSPLLSLIDTSAVGILSGTVQQAALNPAVAVTDYTALLIAFMYTGTTNLIAAARVKDKNDPSAPRTKKTLIGVLKLSTFVGIGLGVVLFGFANPLLRTLIGNDSISPEVFDAAMKYVQIRALGMPAAAVIGSAQAACLGMQDIKSPLYVLVAAAVVNFFGDVLFVGKSHPLLGGAAGAAWATVFSQYAALALFLHWLRHKSKRDSEPSQSSSSTLNVSRAILELLAKPSQSNINRLKRFKKAILSMRLSTSKKLAKPSSSLFSTEAYKQTLKQEVPFSVRGFLHGALRKRDLIQFPNRETLDQFAPYVLPVTTTMVGRLSGYVAMSHVVSSSLGTVSMAAQQVVLSLFYCLTPIADSLSLTAQSFLPSLSEGNPSPERSKALRQTVSNFFKAAGVFGAVMVAAVSCVPLMSGMFTTDPHVISLVNMVVPLLMGIFSVHGVVCSSEGLLLGRKDLGFLGKMYAGFFAIVPYFMLRVKKAALNDTAGIVNLTSVWKVFLGYQLFRTGVWIARLSFLQKQSEQTPSSAVTIPLAQA